MNSWRFDKEGQEPTPRVDALVQIIDGGHEYVSQDKLLPLARQLERELAAANQRAHYEATWHNHYAMRQAEPSSGTATTHPSTTDARRIDNLRRIAADDSVNNFARSICGEAAARLVELSATTPTAEWIVNSLGELGVKVGDDFQFLYKGRSLRYDDVTHTDEGDERQGQPMMWRPVGKREFGECCHPVNYADPTRWGTVSVDDSDEWKPLPASKHPDAA